MDKQELAKQQKLLKEKEKEAKKERKEKLKAMTPDERKAFLDEEKAEKIKSFELAETEHAQKVEEKRKSMENANGWSKFWFNFGQTAFCQWFRKTWSKFSHLHPEGSKLVYQIFYFIVFSEGVTIWQYLVMLFLPNAFGLQLAQTPFVWPEVALWDWSDGTKMIFGIFNEPVRDVNGAAITDPALFSNGVIGGGLGNFIAFEIAVFTAQIINFPLQRNITFKSKGNPVWQATWYFIGWVLISIFVNAVWGFVNPLCMHFGVAKALSDLLKTFITGGLSMVIFFFIFKIIFPEEKKVEEAK